MMYDIWKLGQSYLDEIDMDVQEAVLEQPNFDYVVSITLDTDRSNTEQQNTKIQGISHILESWDYDNSMTKKFPYRKPPSRGSGVLPAAKLNVKDPSKTLPGKITLWFKKLEDDNNSEFDALFEKTRLYLEINETQLTDDLKKLAQSLKSSYKSITGKSKPKIMLTVTYQEEEIQRKFNRYLINHAYPEATRKFAEMYGTTSLGDGTCFYCNKQLMVNGFTAPFPFYTHDKSTFGPELMKERAYQQFPVCDACGVISDMGGKFVEENLNFSFYGARYFLIPQFANDNQIDDLLDSINNKYAQNSNGNIKKVKVNKEKNLTNDEEEILEDLSDFDNSMSLTFIFYQKNQAQMEILEIIPDVLPSRLSTLIDAKKNVEHRDTLRQWAIDISLNPIYFSYGYIRRLFPSDHPGESSNDDKYLREFLQIAQTSIQGGKIDTRTIVRATNLITQAYFANRKDLSIFNTFQTPLVGLYVYEFLDLIGCLHINGQNKGDQIQMTELLKQLNIADSKLAQNVELHFEENKYYDHPMKRGSFIMGVLTREVTKQQYRSLGSEPFYENLNGLRIDSRVAKRLLSEIINKLNEYDANKKQIKSLQTLTAHYFGKFEDNDISKDDMTFAFSLGLSMGQALWNIGGSETNSDDQN